MSHDRPEPVPAALPAVVFILFLVLSPAAAVPRVMVCGFLAVAVLLTIPRIPGRAGAVILFAAAATGSFAGISHHADEAERKALLERLPVDRFVTVTAPLRDDWTARGDASEMVVDRFSLLDPVKAPVEARLRIVVQSGSAPASEGGASVTARGFLRAGEEGDLSLIVKSPLLAGIDGRASRWNPRNWNRAMAARLRRVAESEPSLRRPVQLAEAVALGRTGELPEEAREPYRRGGTYHLLVFSGMQIALAAALVAAATAGLGQPRITDLSLIVLSILAVPFAGWEPSAVRAALMIALYALTRILRRPTSITNLLFVFAVVRLLFCPEEIHEASFQLTCAAVLGVLTAGRAAARHLPAWLRPLGYGCGATLATTPLTLFWFRQWTPAGILSTAILSPLAAAMYFSSAVAAALPWMPMTRAALRLVAFLDRACTLTNGLFGGLLDLRRFAPAPPLALVAGSLLFFAASRGAERKRWRRAGMIALLAPLACSLLLLHERRSVAVPEITVLDVGQGDAILIRSGTRSLLLDGGGHGIDPRFGRRTLIPLLVDRGVTSLDAVALSHPHPDHCGGLLPVLTDLGVRELWLSPGHLSDPCTALLVDEAMAAGIDLIPLATGRARILDGISLSPIVPSRRFKRSAMNNSSVVFRGSVGGTSVLLTGDAEAEAEEWLLENGFDLRAAFLKVAHHGSRTSTSAAFLDAVGPRVAVISCGRHNSFGHPAPSVVETLKRRGVQLYRTDREGSISVACGGRSIRVRHQIDTPR